MGEWRMRPLSSVGEEQRVGWDPGRTLLLSFQGTGTFTWIDAIAPALGASCF